MTNKKGTKRALLASLVSLLLCFSMLIGTTYAWFTDSVKSTNNIITAGNLDVELEYSKDATTWVKLTETSNVFSSTYWEPGHTEVVYLRVSNLGTLSLKYQLGVNIHSENGGINVYDEPFKLSDYIMVGVDEQFDGNKYADRATAISKVTTGFSAISKGYAKSGELAPKANPSDPVPAQCVALVVYMPETVDNKANYKTGTNAPSINLGISVFATQLAAEMDSFGPDYDEAAPWTGNSSLKWYLDDPDATTFHLGSAEDLAGFAAIVNGTAVAPTTTFAATANTFIHDDFAGDTVYLDSDLDLRDVMWTPIGRFATTNTTDFTYAFRGTFDGQDHTISNLYVTNEGWAGLFGIAYQANIKNIKLDGVTLNSNRMTGAVVGQIYGSIDKCHVINGNIKVVPNVSGDSYDNGDKVGGIVGWLGDNGNNRTLTNCSATNVDISAYRDVGGIAGYVAYSTTISGNSVKEISVTVDQLTNNYGEKAPNAGAIWGRNSVSNSGVGVTDENNTIDTDTVVVTATYMKDGIILRQGTNYTGIVLHSIPADYANTTVNVPDGVTTIGGYAFDKNKNIEKIVLPSSVTTLNDRAFRDTSASEIVLNEGLTNISYQAFRNALGVKNVTIPSTVKTISKEAFQNSGVTTLTVPEGVTTIEYGALRDMKELETVTINSNADIPIYAFRACTKLRNVFLNGDNVTFGGGSRGMIFTNKENGDGSAITIIVKNETVKDRLIAADTAAKDYGGYTIIVASEINEVKEADKLTEALANGGYVIMTDDVKAEAATTAPYGNKYGFKLDGGILDGNGNELYIECYGDDYGIMTSGGTIRNLTITEGCRAVMIMSPTTDIILDNVNLGGDGVLYPINTGEAGSDGIKLSVSNSVLAGWTSYSNIESASFTNVEFKQGTYYENIYGRVLKPYVNTTITNCSFVEHMNLDLSGLQEGHKITFSGCTVNGQPIKADVFTIPTADSQYDTDLFTVDLPGWASSIADCIVIK